jgi:hypothetical protein
VVKTLIYLRHGVKGTGEFSDIITEENLQKNPTTNSEGLTAFSWHILGVSNFFHGYLLRTAQTLLSTITKLGLKGRIHQPIKEIGDNDLFKSWKEKGVNFGANSRSNFFSMKEDLSSEDFNNAVDYCRVGLEKMFDTIRDGEIGLAYGHSPVIELCCYSIDKSINDLSLKEYCGAVFDLEKDQLTIVAYINF